MSETINADNWTGESVKLTKINKNRSRWTQYGTRYWIKWEPAGEDGLTCGSIFGSEWSDPIASVFQMAEYDYIASGSGITRQAEEPMIAAAKLICNIV